MSDTYYKECYILIVFDENVRSQRNGRLIPLNPDRTGQLNKGIKALEWAIKYKDIIDKCPQCSTLLVNSET